MTAIQVDPRLPTPPSRQIVEAVLDGIAAGTYAAGDRLPSVRALASEALVNPNTVGKAYRELEALGAVQGRSGAGVFVTPKGPRIARRERQAATLQTLRAALECALRAGHDPAAVLAQIEDWMGAAVGDVR